MLPELLAQLFGQSAVETLRDSKKTIAAPTQGDTNLSLGAASAVFGSLGLLLGLLVALIGAPEGSTSEASLAAIAIFAIMGIACSGVGINFGRRAPKLTHRHLGMAKYGVTVAALGAVLAVVSLVVTAARVFL